MAHGLSESGVNVTMESSPNVEKTVEVAFSLAVSKSRTKPVMPQMAGL